MSLTRRDFIIASSLLGLSISSFPIYSCRNKSTETKESNSDKDFKVNEATIEGLQGKMASGVITSVALTEIYLRRIKEIDKEGPALNSVIEVNPDAIAIAEAMDRERSAGKVRGALHGIPVLIKDNINTGDKMSTTAGSVALEGNKASEDAFVVKQLRAAGAVLLGKTNLSEWANFRSTRASSGWSSRGGQTKNPYDISRTPCGSSSGSGVAVAANLCVVAVGTETDGSIICPSAMNGIVGIKPTVGLISRSGIIPISHTQDTAGPMTRTVRDAAILLGLLTSVDQDDKAMNNSERKALNDYTPFLKKDGLKGKRIGVEKSLLKGHEGIDQLLANAIQAMKQQGAEIIEVDVNTTIGKLFEDELKVLEYEFKDGVNNYLSSSKSNVKSVKEVIAFNKDNEAKVMPHFKQEILERSEAKGDLNSKEYKDALNKNLRISRETIDATLKDNSLSAICGPSYGPAWPIDLINGDLFTGYGLTSPAAISGYPSINVPLGFVSELPIGISFYGTAFGESSLIEIAYAFEQATHFRKEPKFLRG